MLESSKTIMIIITEYKIAYLSRFVKRELAKAAHPDGSAAFAARETWEQIVKWMRIGLRGDAREQDRRGTDRLKGIGSRRGERMRG